ncbi:MAG: glycosyltransferase family 4 protein [Candidatus Hydrogenedentes bacterium]|nr:glycosyltransferase family 4 protein [Candidatus Hydrogenedentota bacterium]
MELKVNGIAFIGNYLPRQCGIATFTTDLCQGMASTYPDRTVFAIAMNDTQKGYAYPPRVQFEVAERELASYHRAADFLNVNDVDVVCLQHEYGIFGGQAGSHIVALLEDLRMPVVTTLHTVLREPNGAQKKVMESLTELTARFVVMSKQGYEFLTELYGIPDEKIDLIHHGIPDVPFVDPNYYKDKFGVEGKMVLLTFGLLSPNKGIEYVIEALPAIIEKYPDVVYICLGATHPHLKREQGESYRLSLQRLVEAKGVESHVIFHNRFVNLEELCEFIGSADIYITPYLNEAQITSGTLAYSVGAGKPVVSTPYWYAQELLADGRGLLVPFRDADAIAQRVIELIENETERHAIRKRAYTLGRDMIWREVSHRYMESFERAREERFKKRRVFVARTVDKRPAELPPLNLDHLRRMTDDTGMLQHATFSVPNYDEGYTTDDNARALVLAVLLEELGDTVAAEARQLAARYLAFLFHAFNPETRRFRNFFSYNRTWLEETGSPDSHGRALWAIGMVAGRSKDDGLRGLAVRMFDEALPSAQEFTSPRACAFTLIGVMEFLRRFYGHRGAGDCRAVLAERLLDQYLGNRSKSRGSDEWLWFEDIVAYSNAKLPHALILCGRWMERGPMVEAGLESLEWLTKVQRMQGEQFVPIGCNGWYRRGGERARFDQQPIEAYATVSACLEAFRMTGEERWRKEAQRAFDWFLGGNDLGAPLYNFRTGGCFDGLTPDRINQNQGAESTLSYLLSRMEMSLAEHIIPTPEG